MPMLEAIRMAAAEVDLAGSFKKLTKMTKKGAAAAARANAAAAAAAAAAAGESTSVKPVNQQEARPQVVVVAHRLSFASSLGSSLSDDGAGDPVDDSSSGDEYVIGDDDDDIRSLDLDAEGGVEEGSGADRDAKRWSVSGCDQGSVGVKGGASAKETSLPAAVVDGLRDAVTVMA